MDGRRAAHPAEGGRGRAIGAIGEPLAKYQVYRPRRWLLPYEVLMSCWKDLEGGQVAVAETLAVTAG